MWDLPGPGLESVSPALAGGFSTTAPPGKSPTLFLNRKKFTDPCLMQSFVLIASLDAWVLMAPGGAQPFHFTGEDQRGWPEVTQMNQPQSWDQNPGLMRPKAMLFLLSHPSPSLRHCPFWEYPLHGPYHNLHCCDSVPVVLSFFFLHVFS